MILQQGEKVSEINWSISYEIGYKFVPSYKLKKIDENIIKLHQ
jgi:hypothetical protein